MPVNLTLLDFKSVAANQKAGVDDAGRLQTYTADKPWYGRVLSKLKSPFTDSTKTEIRQRFLNELVGRYGDFGRRAFESTVGQADAHSLSGRQIQQTIKAAENLVDARVNRNKDRLYAYTANGDRFALALQRAGVNGATLSQDARNAISARLISAFSPAHLANNDLSYADAETLCAKLITVEDRLNGLLPGTQRFLQIANEMHIDPNALKPDLVDKLRNAAHELCKNVANPASVQQIEAELRRLLPAAINGQAAILQYYDDQLTPLRAGGNQRNALLQEVGIVAQLSANEAQILDGEITARVADRTTATGVPMSPAELRAMAREVAANMFRTFDVALHMRLPNGNVDTKALIQLIDHAIKERCMATGEDFDVVVGEMIDEITDSVVVQPGLKDKTLTILDGIVRKSEAEAELAGAVNNTPFARFDPTQFWRLTLDGRFQNKLNNGEPNSLYRGEFGFENEAGYGAGVTRAITSMLGDRNVRLTPARFEQLHDLCVDGVLQRDKTLTEGVFIEKNMRNNTPAAFNADSRASLSQDGLREAQARAQLDPWYRVDVVQQDGFQIARFNCPSRSQDQCRARVTGILDAYYAKVAQFGQHTTENQRLDAIIECCQSLEQSHIFTDANLRNVGFVVLQKLLMQNNLSPTIMFNPNIFDGHSVAEIRGEIRAGWVTFQSYLH